MMTFAHGAREVDAGFDRRDRQTDGQTDSQTDKHCTVIAKFHYTDPDTNPTRTRHGPDTVRSRTKSAHVVGYELNSTTRTRHGPDTDRTRHGQSPCTLSETS